jgi:hypothetical protein
MYGYVANNPIFRIDPYGLYANWGQFAKGVGSFGAGVGLGILATVGEGVTVGVGTPAAIVMATGSAGAISYGIGNMVAAFSNPKDSKQMASCPSSVPQLVARGLGGQPAQDAVGMFEAFTGLNDASTMLETVKAATEFTSATNDAMSDELDRELEQMKNGQPILEHK